MSRRRLEEEISALELERLEYDLSVEKKLTALRSWNPKRAISSREALSLKMEFHIFTKPSAFISDVACLFQLLK